MAGLDKELTLRKYIIGLLLTGAANLLFVGIWVGSLNATIVEHGIAIRSHEVDIKRIDAEGSFSLRAADKARGESIAYIQRQLEEVKLAQVESRREQQKYFEELLRQAKQR